MARFNPPPNWPAAPEGWTPPPGWQPDPAWGPVPEGWQLWIDGASSPTGSPSDHAVPEAAPKPWYTRWWAIALAAVVVLTVVAGIVGGGAGKPAPTASPTTSDSSDPAETDGPVAEADEPPSSAGESPEPEPVPAPSPTEEYSGTGAKVVMLNATDARIVEITHSGGANFTVWAVDDQGQDIDLLVNEIGAYSGVRPLNFFVGDEAAALRIEADGSWTVRSAPVTDAPAWDGRGTYSADRSDVVLVSGAAEGLTPVVLTHDGQSNFAVWAYGDSQSLLANEIGAYSGETLLPAGTLVLAVEADGPWSITKS